MVRLCAIVSLVSGERGRYIFRKMPIRVVYAYEHVFYLREGYKVKPLAESQESLKQLLRSV